MQTRRDIGQIWRFGRFHEFRGFHGFQWTTAIASAALLAFVGAVRPQSSAAQDAAANPLAALQNGELVVWIVEPAAATPLSKALAIAALSHETPLNYQEHDAGTFGQSASSYGTASSNVGVASSSSSISAPPAGTGYREQASGSFGQTSGSTGTASSNYGQTASSLGQTASSYGVDASNHGHDAGTYGNSLSTIAQAGNPLPQPARNLSPQETGDLQHFEQRVSSAFPNLRVKYFSADPGDLQAHLAAAQRTEQYPDVLIAPAAAAGWNGIQRKFGVAMLRPASFRADGVTETAPSMPQLAVLEHAPHLQAARAFAIWISEAGSGCDGCSIANLPRNAQAAASVAISAVTRLLHGEALGGEADPDMASLSPQSALAVLGGANSGAISRDTPLRIEVMRASANGRMAAVTLRAIESSNTVFGVAHPLVVLRRDQDDRWRVLHVSLDLPPAEQQSERETLMNSIAAATDARAGPKGITQASPPSGDTRPPQPVLWWDNAGGASLQVIEWQVDDSSHWSDARLYLAPDVGARLRTQVTARFANIPATYRWRVWSVGAGGEMKISPWSALKIVG